MKVNSKAENHPSPSDKERHSLYGHVSPTKLQKIIKKCHNDASFSDKARRSLYNSIRSYFSESARGGVTRRGPGGRLAGFLAVMPNSPVSRTFVKMRVSIRCCGELGPLIGLIKYGTVLWDW